MEARLAYEGLLRRAPEISLPEQTLERLPNMVVRSLKSLRIEVR